MHCRWYGEKGNGMRCPVESQDNAALLLDYCARKLPPEAADVLEKHMAACPACREFRDRQALVWAALDEWEAMPASRDFDRRLYRRIESRGAPTFLGRVAGALAWKPAAALAAVSLVVLAIALFRAPASPPLAAEGPTDVRIEAAAVDQVERMLEDLEMLREFDLLATAETETAGRL
jgi:hypothetical protein